MAVRILAGDCRLRLAELEALREELARLRAERRWERVE